METLKVTKKLIEVIKKFEFSIPFEINKRPGRVRTELTINYTKKKYHFLDGGKYFLEDWKESPIIAKFKKGDSLDATFKAMFEVAEIFARKELKIRRRIKYSGHYGSQGDQEESN